MTGSLCPGQYLNTCSRWSEGPGTWGRCGALGKALCVIVEQGRDIWKSLPGTSMGWDLSSVSAAWYQGLFPPPDYLDFNSRCGVEQHFPL